MRRIIFILTALSLTACGGGGNGGGNKEYELSPTDVRSKLLGASWEKGILPGFSSHDVSVRANLEDDLEWHVLTDDQDGIWCPIKIEPTGENGERSRVVNDCKGPLRRVNRSLDELVDATLTGRPPKFAE